MPQTTKPSRPQKFGPRALKILAYLAENPYATQRELLDLIKPESLPQYVNFDYPKMHKLEKDLGRYLTEEDYHLVATRVLNPPSNRWGCSYLLPRDNGHTETRASLILRGVVAISPIKRGKCKTYVITPKGMAVLGGLI